VIMPLAPASGVAISDSSVVSCMALAPIPLITKSKCASVKSLRTPGTLTKAP